MPFKKKTRSPMRRRRPRGRATKAVAKNSTESGLSLRQPGLDAPFSKRRFLSDSYLFQKSTMALERREPFTPTVSFPGGRNVSCF